MHRLEQCVCARAEAERPRGELTCFIVQVRFTSPVKGAPVGPSETGVTEYQRYKLSSDSPDHLYLPQALFVEVAAETGMENLRIVQHDETKLLDFYDTAPYRFSVYMDKPVE